MAKEILRLESADERKFVALVESEGNVALKVLRRGWPDRLIQLEYGYSFYIEFKRKGKKPRKLQEHFQKQIRKKKIHVYTCDTYAQALEIYEYEKSFHSHLAVTFQEFDS